MAGDGDDIDQHRNRRLFGGMVGWLMFPGRRPGMLGIARSFTGRTQSGRGVLRRADPDWELSVDGGGPESLTTAEVLHRVGTGGFYPTTVEVAPDLADLLFREAVHQAELSVASLAAEQTAMNDLDGSGTESNLMPCVIATSKLDHTVRASIASIVLAIAAAEAQVNQWAERSGGWASSEDRLGVAKKCRVLAARAERPIDLGKPPFQALHVASKRRNAFVHSMPIEESIPVTGARAPVAGRSSSVESRASCLAVRLSLVDLARRLGEDVPEYLAYCPLTEADDDAAWGSATVMTGVRLDPDFPCATT